jgi:hypothetical protein
MRVVGDGLTVGLGALRLVEVHLRRALGINRGQRLVEREERTQHPTHLVGGVLADASIDEVVAGTPRATPQTSGRCAS